jgi:hypothetical protein
LCDGFARWSKVIKEMKKMNDNPVRNLDGSYQYVDEYGIIRFCSEPEIIKSIKRGKFVDKYIQNISKFKS